MKRQKRKVATRQQENATTLQRRNIATEHSGNYTTLFINI
jgi:hypothetical protein